jgi:uncharacterized protein (DUF2141 family)
MNTLIKGARAAMFAALTMGAGAAPAVAATLVVEVVGLKNADGLVAVAIFSSADGFPDSDAKATIYATASIDPATRSAKVTASDLPGGMYAVAAFHDHNKSGKRETNFLGMPTKGYGFSNNARPKMRAARFDEAAFKLPDGAGVSYTSTIELKY